jgi:magnesium-transporting ATPase (P-type)
VKMLDEQGNEKELSSKTKKKLLGLIQSWASDGLRTLSLTYKDLPANAPVEDKTFECDDELTLIGLVGIEVCYSSNE